jgi:flagellar motor protein MotB
MIAKGSKLKQSASHEGEVDAEGSWAVSYGDMVTLLLTFFILFFNVNQKTEEAKKETQNAILTRLGDSASIEGSKQGKEDAVLRVGPKRELDSIEEQIIKEWGGKAHSIGSRIIIEFPEISFFNFGGLAVNASGVKAIKEFTTRYMPYSGQNILSVKAFTDSVKVSKTKSELENRPYRDNLELSALRSIAAMRVLQKAGIPLDRMRISGHGEFSQEIKKVMTPAAGSNLGDPLSRKIVLIIESETKEKL